MTEILCAKCGLRPGTETWVGEGGALALIHGMTQLWCRRCVLETQLAHAQERAAQIPELTRLLKELGEV